MKTSVCANLTIEIQKTRQILLEILPWTENTMFTKGTLEGGQLGPELGCRKSMGVLPTSSRRLFRIKETSNDTVLFSLPVLRTPRQDLRACRTSERRGLLTGTARRTLWKTTSRGWGRTKHWNAA